MWYIEMEKPKTDERVEPIRGRPRFYLIIILTNLSFPSHLLSATPHSPEEAGKGREGRDALVVVDLSIAVDVRLANHLLDFLVAQLFACTRIGSSV